MYSPRLSRLFTEMAQKTLGHIPELLLCIDDPCVLPATRESHIDPLKSSKIPFGPKLVTYLGHVISDEEVSVGTDRIQAIHKLVTLTSL